MNNNAKVYKILKEKTNLVKIAAQVDNIPERFCDAKGRLDMSKVNLILRNYATKGHYFK